ncbi:DUF4388 domain-containing protein [candidate division KSB3 bacterium]|uniref:DUF4388 domain-containing protein n=1 Tax=candidate division KSB3 bacterium TaxID=2044937 RepID=A0A9D5JYB7_9BACT|nr:DUF4388 domain-containing protein [candidate division KSB3 bacterium]MBD3326330.1 DUF4388 domain-containing protein [candidate division KSB3 bacterium]
MKGNLAAIGGADIVKALCLIGKSGRLTITSEEETGLIYLKSGNVINAEDGNLRGEDALYSLILKDSGQFHYEPAMTLVDQNIHLGSESLFIGLSSQVDRYHYLLARGPKLDDRLRATPLAADAPYDEEARTIARLLSKPLSLRDALKRSPYSRLKTMELVSRLSTDQIITITGKSAPIATDEEEDAASLEADLKVVSIGEVVQILVLTRRDGRLTAQWDDREGEVYIQHGNLTFASVESLEGLGAVYRLLTWKDGTCQFFANEEPTTQNIRKNIERIFVEGIDILAKFNKFMDEFPSLNAYVDVISVTGQETISPKESKILKIVNEHETLNDVIKHSPYSDVETLEIAAKLYSQRMIGLSKGLRGQKEVDYDKEAEDLLKDLL